MNTLQQEQLILEILKEFDEKFVGIVQIPSNTTATYYETSGLWKEDPCGGYETMTQPYQVKEFIIEKLNLIATKSAATARAEGAAERKGMTVKIWFTDDSPFGSYVETLENVTEIHYCYKSLTGEQMIAFENDIDGTGMTYQKKWVKEFEALTTKEHHAS